MQQDIIVVGAGMVGLTCVLALAKQGFRVTLVEANEMPPQPLPEKSQAFDNRVVAISRASQQLFMQLGVWSIIENSRCAAYQQMKVWDNTLDGKIDFCAMDYFEPNLGHTVEQQVILGAVLAILFTASVYWLMPYVRSFLIRNAAQRPIARSMQDSAHTMYNIEHRGRYGLRSPT